MELESRGLTFHIGSRRREGKRKSMGIGKLFVGLELFLADRKDTSRRKRKREQNCKSAVLVGKKRMGTRPKQTSLILA